MVELIVNHCENSDPCNGLYLYKNRITHTFGDDPCSEIDIITELISNAFTNYQNVKIAFYSEDHSYDTLILEAIAKACVDFNTKKYKLCSLLLDGFKFIDANFNKIYSLMEKILSISIENFIFNESIIGDVCVEHFVKMCSSQNLTIKMASTSGSFNTFNFAIAALQNSKVNYFKFIYNNILLSCDDIIFLSLENLKRINIDNIDNLELLVLGIDARNDGIVQNLGEILKNTDSISHKIKLELPMNPRDENISYMISKINDKQNQRYARIKYKCARNTFKLG